MSTRKEYYVLSAGNQWKVRFEGKDYFYATQAKAIEAARDHARQQFALGHNAQVHVQNVVGRWRTEWTYGNDPERYHG